MMKRRDFLKITPVIAASATAADTFAVVLPSAPNDTMPPIAASTESLTSRSASKPVLVFDVIETLLDLQSLGPVFEQTFGARDALKDFFAQMLQSAFAVTIAGRYSDFGSVAKSALAMMAEKRKIPLSDAQVGKLLSGIRTLPAHPEVPKALEKLKSVGYRMVALTNSALPVLESQVSHAGLTPYFDKLMSVDAVKRFKPAPEVYQFAARAMLVETKDLRMIAAHSWDVGGAMQAGCRAAFVARPGMVLDALFQHPEITGPDLLTVAEKIIAIDREHAGT